MKHNRRLGYKKWIGVCAALFMGCGIWASGTETQVSKDLLWSMGEEGEILMASIPAKGHKDHFAMSGRSVDVILEWEVTPEKEFRGQRLIRWPMLRMVPDNTHASFDKRFSDQDEPKVLIEGEPLGVGVVESVKIDGLFRVIDSFKEGLKRERKIFPSSSGPAILDQITLTNTSNKPLNLEIPAWMKEEETTPQLTGIYVTRCFVQGDGSRILAPGESYTYTVVRAAHQKDMPPYYDLSEMELSAREAFVDSVGDDLVLETPEKVLNEMFRFAKIRATESIFATRGGLMHGPGGYNKFLAAIWTNDQVEYVNPFFPFLGNVMGNDSAMNCYRWYTKFMNPEFKAIPPSIISEGRGIWKPGDKERGDMAMIAYGASRFVLATGNKDWAQELLPLIDWSLEFCRRRINSEGVVESELDELEGRFPCGSANLCTSTLYYDGLVHAAYVHEALGRDKDKAKEYTQRAAEMKKAIARYFEAEVQGFDTYKYYKENDILRSWICMPLVVGMFERAEATTDALFSDKLWFGHGMLTAANTKTYWDRSALYAFRGIFFSGQQDKALPKLIDYSKERLMGQHVPYAIEAWPEAGQSHLSAESGLYCRIFTEGLFGIDPTGFRSFSMMPRLPKSWKEASLKNMKAFGHNVSIDIKKKKGGVETLVKDYSGKVLYQKTLPEGEAHQITLP